jgi:subtilisin-like proprotein convertase family protein
MRKKTLLFVTALLIILSAGKSYSQMYWNYAAAFSGNANSYIVAPNGSLGIVGSFTLEAWVNPSAVNGARTFIAKNTTGSYGLTITNGRAAVFTNNTYRLLSKASTLIPVNKWTHIAGTYNWEQNKFELYINGTLDSTAIVAGAFPNSVSDSLYIGKNGGAHYQGLLDDVRIWSTNLTADQIKRNMRTSIMLSNTDNYYSGLKLSLTFQNHTGAGNPFSLFDKSTSGNHAFNRGALEANLTNKLYSTVSDNEALEFDGSGDYATAGHTSYHVINNSFTLEAWVFLRSGGTQQVIARKRTISGGYEMYVSAGNKLAGVINGTALLSNVELPIGRWVHTAFTYKNQGGILYIDGVEAASSDMPAIQSSTEPLYVGGMDNQGFLNGYIDELRIAKYAKTQAQIREFMYKSMTQTNDPATLTQDITFNFDGYTSSSTYGLAGLNLKGDTKFSSPNVVEGTPISPLIRNDALTFSNGFNIKTTNKRIPEAGTMGAMQTDSLYIPVSQIINDINVFVAVNHSYDPDLEITLFSPAGDSVNLCFDHSLNTNRTGDIITIFDSNADSLIQNGVFNAYAPAIKPDANINNAFFNESSQGYWRLKINDDANGDTGRVYAWGIQFNNTTLVGAEQVSSIVPAKYELSQNYPNPFNPVTNIKFSIPQSGVVKLKVFDILGKEVATLVNEFKQAGTYNANFDGAKLSSGAYFYRLETESFTDTKKMLLVK